MLHQMAKTYGSPPSSLIGIQTGTWVAFQFDRTVASYGLFVESKLSERDDKHKPKHTLDEILVNMNPANGGRISMIEQALNAGGRTDV